MRRTVVLGKIAVVVALAATGAGCGQPRWQSELVTVNAAGSAAIGGIEDGPIFSPDGTKIVFATSSTDLGYTDTNGQSDVYVRDLMAGTTTLVSVNQAGTGTGDAYSWRPVFTPDGKKVAFQSGATDLHPIGAPGSRGIYLRDLEAGTTVPVSLNNAGNTLIDGGTPAFSADGTKMLFVTTANHLGPPDFNALEDVYMRDFVAGTTTLVSVNPAGTNALGYSYDPGFSPDGTKVVFENQNAGWGLTMRDLVTGTTTLLAPDGADHIFSADGTKIAFTSPYPGFGGPPDTNDHHDAFVRDLATGATTLVSVNSNGSGTGNAPSYASWISPDGTKVVFTTHSSTIVQPDTNNKTDVFLRDLSTGTTTLISTNAAGTDSGNEISYAPSVSPDGTRVAFASKATNLGPKDTTQCTRYPPPPNPPVPYKETCIDVYVRDLVTGKTSLVSVNSAGADSADADTDSGAFSPVASDQIALRSRAGNLGAITDTNGREDIYLARLPASP